MNRLSLTAAVCALTVGLRVANGAQLPAAESDALIFQGIQMRKEGRDLDALPLFQKAAKLQPTPRAVAQLGTCEQAAGLWVKSEGHLQQALKQGQDPWIRKNEVALREALAHVQDRIGSVEIWGTPAGAKVSIDGEVVGTLPVSGLVRTAEGRRVVSIEAPGFLPEKRAIEVRPTELKREHVVLASLGAPPPVEAPPIREGTTVEQPISSPPVAPIPEQLVRPVYQRWWFWTLVGTAVVAGGASAYFILRDDSCEASMGGKCVKF